MATLKFNPAVSSISSTCAHRQSPARIQLDTATGVSPHRPISATFSKAMAPGSFTGNFTIAGVTGTVSYDDVTHTATFTPGAALAAHTLYTATINTSVTDSYGVPLASPYSWSFTTGDLDTTAPSITARSPVPDAMDVPVSTEVSVTFDEELAAGSLDLDHFVLTGPYGVVPAAFDYDPVTFTVTLDAECQPALQHGLHHDGHREYSRLRRQSTWRG